MPTQQVLVSIVVVLALVLVASLAISHLRFWIESRAGVSLGRRLEEQNFAGQQSLRTQ